MNSLSKRLTQASAGALMIFALTGCAAADVLGITQAQAALDAVAHEQDTTTDAAETESAAAAEPTPAAVATESALVALQAPTGDLASGSVTHSIPAGSGTINLNFWTNQNPAEWTNDISVPVYLNVTVGDAGAKAKYTINAFSAKTTEAQLVADVGNYEITPPFSYFTTMVVGPTDAESVEIVIEMEISMETAEGTGDYTKVRVADTLRVDFAAEAAEAPATADLETRTTASH
jgi:hypothetical protein